MFGDLGDIFGGMFSGGGRGRGKPRGRDVAVEVQLGFHDSVFGVEKEIALTKTNGCDRCGGVGAEPGTKLAECKTCKGKGFVTGTQRTILGNIQTRQACESCAGRGEVPEKACTTCQGSGVTRGRANVRVHIPAGVEDGVQVRVRGEGEAAPHGGEPGDLFLHVRVTPDRRFERQGDTIYVTKNIGFTQAALGDEVEVDTVDGKVSMKIPAGTQSGDHLRLRGKGVAHGRGRGDQIVIVQVVTPKKLSREERELLEKLDHREN